MREKCCTHACQQGRACPLRKKADRREATPLLWRWLGWLMKERRSGWDRRRTSGINDN